MAAKVKWICLGLFLLIASSIHAQKSEVGNWFLYLGNQKINDRWNLHSELQYRNFNFAGDLEQLIIRTGLGYNLSENNNNVLLGYAYIHSEPYIFGTTDKRQTKEHRVFQQFITKQSFGRVNVQHRYRFEQRFLQDDFKMRFRYLLMLNIPINKKTMEKTAVYASLSNEIFINTEQNHYDRDRVYGGIGYCFNKNFKMEVGLMSQLLSTNSRAQFQIMIFNNLPF
ncbi:DUF2490 domain-containing protein [Flavobacterium sp.]|uniref:DUF2490 domain-containing protein n=1 Tax=Flavobacterium sp. TaxID=239 RepID=UPI001B473904|nr:DUF2490 domain-containing protein [Flavobacterium sp.]MBP6181138.1 DUF2490 domain-containing protein [Flavobacterium sp.]